MPDPRTGELLSRELLRALGLLTEGRPEWLGVLLRAVRRAVDGGVVYLAESVSEGWVRTGLVQDQLDHRTETRLLGLSRRMASGNTSILEPRIGPGSRFRTRCDGWPPYRAAGYAAVSVPRAPRPAWLAALAPEEGPAFGPGTLPLLELAAEALGSALRNERRWQELEDLAMTDGLTKIPNYRHLRVAVEREIARAERLAEFFTVVMVDVDNLKQYNAAHGHLAGSEILRVLAGLLRENVRKTDMAAKYGGDEFVLLLPRTHPSGGQALSERIRREIAASVRGIGGEVVSCSFGVAGYPGDGTSFEGLMQAADRALFRAKAEGRNAVVCLAAEEGRGDRRGEGDRDRSGAIKAVRDPEPGGMAA